MTDERRRPFSRRDALTGLASLGGLALARHAGDAFAAQCVLTPAQTEGPYFVDERLDRADVRSDPTTGAVSAGVPLALELVVSRQDGAACSPLAGAVVDVWQCDAGGNYSDVNRTRGMRFLRGYQRTDAAGRVRFTTIYPGAYPGRAVHIHFRVRGPQSSRPLDFTSQLYFDDALTDRVHAAPAYAAYAGRRTRNAADGLYADGGRDLQLDVTGDGTGYAARYAIDLRSG